jgi:hypothetical protein
MLVKVIKKNFTQKLKEAMDDSMFGIFAKSFGADITNLPEEQEIYLDTQYIVEIDSPLPEEFGGGAFTVKLAIANDKNPCVYVKNECFEELVKAKQADCEKANHLNG